MGPGDEPLQEPSPARPDAKEGAESFLGTPDGGGPDKEAVEQKEEKEIPEEEYERDYEARTKVAAPPPDKEADGLELPPVEAVHTASDRAEGITPKPPATEPARTDEGLDKAVPSAQAIRPLPKEMPKPRPLPPVAPRELKPILRDLTRLSGRQVAGAPTAPTPPSSQTRKIRTPSRGEAPSTAAGELEVSKGATEKSAGTAEPARAAAPQAASPDRLVTSASSPARPDPALQAEAIQPGAQEEVPFLDEGSWTEAAEDHGPPELRATSGEIEVPAARDGVPQPARDKKQRQPQVAQQSGASQAAGVISGSIQVPRPAGGARTDPTKPSALDQAPEPASAEVAEAAGAQKAERAETASSAETKGKPSEPGGGGDSSAAGGRERAGERLRGGAASEAGSAAAEDPRAAEAAKRRIAHRAAAGQDLDSGSPEAPSVDLEPSRSKWWLALAAAAVVALGAFLLVRSGSDRNGSAPPSAPTAGLDPGEGAMEAVDARASAAMPDASKTVAVDAARQARPVPDAAAPARPAVDPAVLAEQLKQARRLMKQRKAKEAETLLRALLERDPDHAEARTLLGQLHFRAARKALDRAQYPKATERGRKAVRYDPDNAEAWMALGFALIQIKKKGEARAALKRYLVLCPDCRWTGYVKKTLAGLK
jgi:tetratricopeptide (TPR) repeat protein